MLMEMCILENGTMTITLDLESWSGMMAEFMKVIGWKALSMEVGYLRFRTAEGK